MKTSQKRRDGFKRWYNVNKETAKAATLRWRKNNPEAYRRYVRNSAFKQKYGITLEERDAMLEAQDGRCAICGTDQPGKRGFFVDHNHATGKVRALLCHRCNSGLGYLQESVSFLQKAIEYLNKHEGRQ